MRTFPGIEAFLRRCLLAGVVATANPWAAAGVVAAPGATLPETAHGWRAAALADIEAAVKLTRENHPGPHDPHNPGFRASLDSARTHGLALAARVENASGYLAALDGFNARIGDGHAGMAPNFDESNLPPPRWPGFVTVWRGDALYVHSAQAGKPAVGSKLLDCDGKPARQLILDNVFRFRGRADEAGQWWLAARRLFIDAHNPFVELPQRCRFEAGGKASEHRLAWSGIDAEGKGWLEHSAVGATRPVGIAEVRKNLYWVAMPTFQPNEEQRAAYRAMVREVETERARFLAADAIVVDLRRNQGGSSTWSRDFAKALFGSERVTRAMAHYSADTKVWWRASAGNTDYVFSLAETLKRQASLDTAGWVALVADGMRAALARGDRFYVEPKAPRGAPGKQKVKPGTTPDAPPFTRPFYVVVPGNCASACLDAIDVFTRFPNTVLVGAPSSADSTYMEVRRANLESGLAAVIVPNKVYVRRGRANGQFYRPHVPVTKVAWSTEVLQQAVEADLARRR